MTGQVAGQPFSVHAEGERVYLTRPGQPRQEVELVGPPAQPTDQALSEVPLPEPVCPHGAPASALEATSSAPGVSWYDTAPWSTKDPASTEEAPPPEGGVS